MRLVIDSVIEYMENQFNYSMVINLLTFILYRKSTSMSSLLIIIFFLFDSFSIRFFFLGNQNVGHNSRIICHVLVSHTSISIISLVSSNHTESKDNILLLSLCWIIFCLPLVSHGTFICQSICILFYERKFSGMYPIFSFLSLFSFFILIHISYYS